MDFELQLLLERIQTSAPPHTLRIMNVCGGHERTITQAGLRGVLPPQIELIAGPGCPVCICPEEDIHAAIRLALHEAVTVVAFGDMLRVPVNGSRAAPRSLEQARAQGADIRAIASPQQAVDIAAHSDRDVIFLAAGFETTMAPVAAMLQQTPPPNLKLLCAGRRTWPAVHALLQQGDHHLDALIAPGHVATIMGSEEWRFVAEDFALPVAVGGFTVTSLLSALFAVIEQINSGEVRLDNCYPEAVQPDGNPLARRALRDTFTIGAGNWRGIGTLPESAYRLRPAFAGHDAWQHYPLADDPRRRRGENPPGCDCADVVMGRLRPDGCRLYGSACTPRHPIGPCMVSEEGACHIWWAGGIRKTVAAS